MLPKFRTLDSLSRSFDIPLTDVFLIALNFLGSRSDLPYSRVRFKIYPKFSNRSFYFAICLNTRETPFWIDQKQITLDNEPIAKVKNLENDLAEISYFRRNQTTLVLNTNLRTKCLGCDFCGSQYQKARIEKRFLTKDEMNKLFIQIMDKNVDISNLVEIAINTGLFPTEDFLYGHLMNIINIAKEYGFHGEIKYIGSQIRKKEYISKIISSSESFSYYLTVETFTNKNLKCPLKRMNLQQMRYLLNLVKNLGGETSFLYILGLEPLININKFFPMFKNTLTRFPVINIYQTYHPKQEKLRIIEAKKINYYLKSRKIIEKIFLNTNLRPKIWENYRGLWYTKFGEEEIKDELQTFATIYS